VSVHTEVFFTVDQPRKWFAGAVKSWKFERLEWVSDGTQLLFNGSDTPHQIGERELLLPVSMPVSEHMAEAEPEPLNTKLSRARIGIQGG
jgi:hypothetical protein